MDRIDSSKSSSDSQFTLQTLLWLTTAVALLLTYANSLGAEALAQSLIYAAVALLVGTLFGIGSRRWKDCYYWVSLMTLLAFLGVAGGRLPTVAIVYGWSVIGAISGGLAAIEFPRRLWQGALLTATVATVLMIVALKLYSVPVKGLVLFDVFCAGGIGATIRPAIHWLKSVESQSKQSRLLIASWLTISVLVGNLLVPVLGGTR